MASDKEVKRRRGHGEDVRRQVMAECEEPGASVAQVAMAHGINANVVHRWRQLSREAAQATVAKAHEFVPVTGAPLAQNEKRAESEVELRRGAVTMKVTWPASAAADFAAWTRELLR